MNPRAKKLVWIGCLTGIVGVALGLLLFFCDPARVPIYPVCAFHSMTGLQCPGCGSLRAMHELLHGNIAAALRLNAMLVVSLPFLMALAVRLVRRQWQHQPGPVVRTQWLWLFLVAWLAFGVLRNVHVSLFAASGP